MIEFPRNNLDPYIVYNGEHKPIYLKCYFNFSFEKFIEFLHHFIEILLDTSVVGETQHGVRLTNRRLITYAILEALFVPTHHVE